MNSGLRKKSKWGHSDRIEFWLVAKIERTLAKTEDFAGMQWILNSEFQCPSLKLWFQTLPKAQGTQGIEDFDSFNTFNIRTSPTICGALIVFSPEDCKLVWLSQIRNFLHLCVQFPLILYYQTPFLLISAVHGLMAEKPYLSFFVRRPAMVTSPPPPLLLAPDPQTHTFSESLW